MNPADIRDMLGSMSEFEFRCNFLMPAGNLDTRVFSKIFFFNYLYFKLVDIYLKFLARLYGNWVGGHAVVSENAVLFRANMPNRILQNTDIVSIPYETMRLVKPGRMFFVFETVDIETDHGLKRFRMFSKERAQFTALVRPMVGRPKLQSPSAV